MAYTLERHIVDQQRKYPKASGKFTQLLFQIAFAAKVIAQEVRRAGIGDILGLLGKKNVFGEEMQKLDMFAHQLFFKSLDHTGLLSVMLSEESEGIMPIPAEFPTGPYVFIYDPLDGSSNIDVNVSVGTIFSIHRKITKGERGIEKDCLQPGRQQVCAGYIVYGSSTMLVYTVGTGVYGFTLDPGIGEFVMSHPDMKYPAPKKSKNYFSVNMGNYHSWSTANRKYIDSLINPAKNDKHYSLRYIGSLIADFHRNLVHGGIFLYPADYKKNPLKPEAKLRLLIEAAPLSFIAEQAGGKGSNGLENILDITPASLHQKVPLAIGPMQEVEAYEHFIQEYGTVDQI